MSSREPFRATSKIDLRTIRWGKILYSKMLGTPQCSQIENPEVGRESGPEDSTLGLEPFPEKRTSLIDRVIKSESMEKKDNTMKLLRLIWGHIAKKPKKEIDHILRGPRDVVMQNNKEPVSLGKKDQRTRVVYFLLLQNLAIVNLLLSSSGYTRISYGK
ncbi:hypothetical protein Hanom_Chr07g00672481 [Helianthus anomalus]